MASPTLALSGRMGPPLVCVLWFGLASGGHPPGGSPIGLEKIPLHLTKLSLESTGGGSNYTFIRRYGATQEGGGEARSQPLQLRERLWTDAAGSLCNGTKPEMKKMHSNCIWS